MSFDGKDFASRLEALIPSKMQKTIAARAGVNPKTIQRWVAKERTPDIHDVRRIAEVLGVSPSYLAFGETPATKTEQSLLDAYRTLEGEPDLTKMILSIPHPKKPGVSLELSPVERIVKPVNRRSEIAVLKILKREHVKPNAKGLPQWLNLAAGEGMDLSLCEDLVYFEERDNFKGMHTAQVRGDSMIDTLLDGDVIVLKPFHAGSGVQLPSLESESEKTSLYTWQAAHGINEGAICVVSINEGAPTLKRVHYDTRRGKNNWKLQILADNPARWEPFQADTSDSITFYAKLVARAE